MMHALPCRLSVCLAGIFVCTLFNPPVSVSATKKPPQTNPTSIAAAAAAAAVDGRELFVREWLPGDERSHGGDGLGPLFNDSSCVACHNQGGAGGAGPRGKNVDVLTAFSRPVHAPRRQVPRHVPQAETSLAEKVLASMFHKPQLETPQTQDVQEDEFTVDANVPSAAELKAERDEFLAAANKRNREQLAKFHPAFAQGNSIVLHKSATYAGYQGWRENAAQGVLQSPKFDSVHLFDAKTNDVRPQNRSHLRNQLKNRARQSQQSTMQARLGNFTLTRSQRNATALFGAGLIEGVSRETLEQLAAKQQQQGVVSGRVPLLKDNTLGRFGWKGQTSSLQSFVMTACAVEVGLNVPNHPQSGLPHSPGYRPTGLDLNLEECNALVEYVQKLPAPIQKHTGTERNAKFVQVGAELFASIGCASCHVENVGAIHAVFSDLLLHDLGDDLGDSGGSYGIFVPDSTPDGQLIPQMADANKTAGVIGATRKEWRTPPLWGVRDSAPYLHDGRADTLEQAIAIHGGEAENSVNRYLQLSQRERFQVVTFLRSLVAPQI